MPLLVHMYGLCDAVADGTGEAVEEAEMEEDTRDVDGEDWFGEDVVVVFDFRVARPPATPAIAPTRSTMSRARSKVVVLSPQKVREPCRLFLWLVCGDRALD